MHAVDRFPPFFYFLFFIFFKFYVLFFNYYFSLVYNKKKIEIRKSVKVIVGNLVACINCTRMTLSYGPNS